MLVWLNSSEMGRLVLLNKSVMVILGMSRAGRILAVVFFGILMGDELLVRRSDQADISLSSHCPGAVLVTRPTPSTFINSSKFSL